LGNARTFLINWALARQRGWTISLRIEDLDGPRVKPEAARAAIDDLRWLGIDWDEGPVYQSHNLNPYRSALKKIADRGLAYPCDCTRQQIQAATLSAPHGEDHELRYPGTCRPVDRINVEQRPLTDADLQQAWRLRVPDGLFSVADQFGGERSFDVQRTIGDFLIWTKQGLPSYQLAVVVDDARQGIDQIVRGDDLWSSAARQQLLYDSLELEPRPEYFHLPLVLGPDGKRLAKRHGDSRIASYRRHGVSAERVIGLLARWSGINEGTEMSAADFRDSFRLDRLPASPVTFRPDDDAWLSSSRTT
jgi:glutamyl-tRNA synthetase